MYKGDAPCPGCGKKGSDKPRKSKDGLCPDCVDALKLGYSVMDRLNIKINHYLVPDHSKVRLTWYTIRIKAIENTLVYLLRTFSEYHTDFISYWQNGKGGHLLNDYCAVTASHTIDLPDPTINAAIEFCKVVKQVSEDLEEKERNYKEELEKQLNEERNDIYNQGVQHGRNLLAQLNNNEITPEELNKRIKIY